MKIAVREEAVNTGGVGVSFPLERGQKVAFSYDVIFLSQVYQLIKS